MRRIQCTECGNQEAEVLLQLIRCPNQQCRYYDARTRRDLSRRRLSGIKVHHSGAYWVQPG